MTHTPPFTRDVGPGFNDQYHERAFAPVRESALREVFGRIKDHPNPQCSHHLLPEYEPGRPPCICRRKDGAQFDPEHERTLSLIITIPTTRDDNHLDDLAVETLRHLRLSVNSRIRAFHTPESEMVMPREVVIPEHPHDDGQF